MTQKQYYSDLVEKECFVMGLLGNSLKKWLPFLTLVVKSEPISECEGCNDSDSGSAAGPSHTRECEHTARVADSCEDARRGANDD